MDTGLRPIFHGHPRRYFPFSLSDLEARANLVPASIDEPAVNVFLLDFICSLGRLHAYEAQDSQESRDMFKDRMSFLERPLEEVK